MSTKARIIIPAYRIAEKTRSSREIQDYVNQHLALIEADIETALENEIDFAITELDVVFQIPYMSYRDAQREVYYHTAHALMKAGYFVRLKFLGLRADDQRVFLVTRWINHKEKQIDTYKDDFLRQITLDDKSDQQYQIPERPKLTSLKVGKYPRPNPDEIGSEKPREPKEIKKIQSPNQNNTTKKDRKPIIVKTLQ